MLSEDEAVSHMQHNGESFGSKSIGTFSGTMLVSCLFFFFFFVVLTWASR